MSGVYTRELVERLMHAIWDGDAIHGIGNPYSPDPDMPKGATNKKAANTLYAHLADIWDAWKRCDLEREERRALFMRHGLDWTQQEIGRHEGVNQSTALRRIERGVGKLTAWLNGDEYIDGYDIDIEEDTTT